MAALFFEAFVGVERAEGGLGEVGEGEETELDGGLAGVEEHAEVGGGELADLDEVFFFDVIGDEPVIFFVAELLEVAPDLEGLLMKKERVLSGERAFFVARWGVEPVGHEWGDSPEKQNRCGGIKRSGMVETKANGYHDRDGGRKLEVDVERVFRGTGFGLGCGLPLEESLAGEVAADERTDDGVERKKHVVREKGEVEDGESDGGGESSDALAGAGEAEFEEGASEVEG